MSVSIKVAGNRFRVFYKPILIQVPASSSKLTKEWSQLLEFLLTQYLPTQSGVPKEFKIQMIVASGNFTIDKNIYTEEQGCVIPQSAVWILLYIIPKLAACMGILSTYKVPDRNIIIQSISNTAFEWMLKQPS